VPRPAGPKPAWLRKPLVHGNSEVRRIVRRHALNTVCEEARCPNRHECWGTHRTATFMLLGSICTRNCRFCSVTKGRPLPVDAEEPERVARAVADLGLRYAVITMTARDDLHDGGAAIMAEAVRAIRRHVPGCRVEILASDFRGRPDSVATLAGAAPEVYGHNIETVRRLSRFVRRTADYDRSLGVLRMAREMAPHSAIKSAILLGFGEERHEIVQAMDDLRAAGVDLLTICQYLQPTRGQLPVQRYYTPEEFAELREEALSRGFAACESGPWVRSSYRADAMYEAWLRRSRGSAASSQADPAP